MKFGLMIIIGWIGLGGLNAFNAISTGETERTVPEPEACREESVAETELPALDEEAIVKILREADRARGNQEGISWTVKVRTNEKGEIRDSVFEVKARGFDVLASTERPRRNRGNIMLMNDGNMWFYKPGLSKPAPISQRQKLAGNAAYGDIAATNYAEDYTATLIRTEPIGDDLCYVFNLQAESRRCTYDKIVYYVSIERRVGVKAEYYTLSGKVLKSSRMKYENVFTDDSGKPSPFISEMAIYDELMSSDSTVMTFSEPKLRSVPRSTFDINLLQR